MGAILNSFSAFLLLLSVLQQGWAAKCSISSIAIKQARTGGVVEGKPEYEVTVSNNCICPQSKLLVRCFGLSSVLPVNFHAIRPVGDTYCVVNNQRPIIRGSPVKFKYAWMTPQDFSLVRSEIKC